MSFNSVDKVILDVLLRRKSVSIYDLHAEFRFTPTQLNSSVLRLVEAGMVIGPDDRMILTLTPNYREVLFRNRRSVYKRNTPWRSVPSEFAYHGGDIDTLARLNSSTINRLGNDVLKRIKLEEDKLVRKHGS